MENKRKIEKARQHLLNEILACTKCRPCIEKEILWYNPHTDLDDLLFDFEMKEQEWKTILYGLKCPNCYEPFETQYDLVEIKSDYDHSVEETFTKLKNKNIVKKLYDFNKFISEYPYLGLSSSSIIGTNLFNSIKKGKIYTIDSDIWYRARKFNNESKLFSSDEMWAPDPQEVFIRISLKVLVF